MQKKLKLIIEKNLINKIVKVLFENKMKNKNKYFGRDEYFNSILLKVMNDLTGKIKNVKILKRKSKYFIW